MRRKKSGYIEIIIDGYTPLISCGLRICKCPVLLLNQEILEECSFANLQPSQK